MRICRADDNQPEIVKAFRKLGWTVAHTHTVGKGFVDIVCSKGGHNILVEIKDGTKPPSKRVLTPDEQKFHASWQGPIYIVESVEQVFEIHRSVFL